MTIPDDELDDLDRELYALFALIEASIIPDPAANERLIARVLASSAQHRAQQAQTGDTVMQTQTIETVSQTLGTVATDAEIDRVVAARDQLIADLQAEYQGYSTYAHWLADMEPTQSGALRAGGFAPRNSETLAEALAELRPDWTCTRHDHGRVLYIRIPTAAA